MEFGYQSSIVTARVCQSQLPITLVGGAHAIFSSFPGNLEEQASVHPSA